MGESRSTAGSKPFDISKTEGWQAWEQVKANQGSAGVDAVEVSEFEDRVQDHLYKVWNRMVRRETFRCIPDAVR